MEAISFLIYGLAVWRISSLLVNENGPFNIFRWVRSKAGVMYDLDWNLIGVQHKFFAELLSCVWCCSLYVAIGILIGRFYFSQITYYVCMGLALSALAILFEKWVRP